MKIVVLKSSPHQHGDSNTLASYFIKGATEAGHKVCEIDVNAIALHPCRGCQGNESGRCLFSDDIGPIETELTDAQMVVYVTPVYFYDMSAQLKLVVDRLRCFRPNLRGKKSLLLATAYRDDDEVMSYLKALYTGIAAYIGYEDLGVIMARGCHSPEDVQDSVYAARAYELGKSLTE